MDVTFFGRKFGVMVFMNSLTDTVIYHQIVKTEKAIYYKVVMNKLREKGYKIQSITCDGKHVNFASFIKLYSLCESSQGNQNLKQEKSYKS